MSWCLLSLHVVYVCIFWTHLISQRVWVHLYKYCSQNAVRELKLKFRLSVCRNIELRVFKTVLVDLKLIFTKEATTEKGSMFLMQLPKWSQTTLLFLLIQIQLFWWPYIFNFPAFYWCFFVIYWNSTLFFSLTNRGNSLSLYLSF